MPEEHRKRHYIHFGPHLPMIHAPEDGSSSSSSSSPAEIRENPSSFISSFFML